MRVLLSLAFVFAFPFVLKHHYLGESKVNRSVIQFSLIGYLIIVLCITLLCRKLEDKTVIYFDVLKSHRYILRTIHEGFVTSGISGAIKRYHWVKGTIEGHTLNTVLFIPFGYLMPLQRRGAPKPYWIILLAFLFSLFIECGQLMTHRGWFDANDLLHNTLGAMIGLSIYRCILCDDKSKPVGGVNENAD